MIRSTIVTVVAAFAAGLFSTMSLAVEPAVAASEQSASDAAPVAEAGTAAAAAAGEYTPPPGYKTRKKKGETVYCRKRAPLGTRLKTEECFNKAEILEVEHAMRVNRDDQAQRGRMCTTGAMCKGG